MSLKIFYDYQTFAQQSYGGISRYFCELITGINNTENCAHLSLLHSNNVHLKEYGFNIMPYYFPKRNRLLHKSNRIYNYIDVVSSKFDIYHPTYFDPFLLDHIGNKPCVVTFYDMIYEKFGTRFNQLSIDKGIIEWKRNISKKASGIIAISENTKNDMVQYLNISPDLIKVIYLGSSLNLRKNSFYLNRIVVRPYILFVGNRDMYKNFNLFLLAVAPILRAYKISLVCAGGGDFSKEENKLIREQDVSHLVKQEAITDDILVNLYTHALAFIFPSLYEGFGIPVIEAMSCGCPCILSNQSSLPEIAGDAALYFNPEDIDDIRFVITKFLDDYKVKGELTLRGLKRAEEFTWERTVRDTLTLYNDVVNAK